MNEEYRRKLEEREIDLKDLICDVCLHWRSIIVGALVGLILIGAFGAYKSYKAAQVVVPVSEEAAKEEATTDINTLNMIAQQIIANDKFFAAQQDYFDNSVLMRNDLTEIYTQNDQYLITVDKEHRVDLSNLVNSYTYAIQSDKLYETVAKEIGDVDKSYVYELISVSNSIIDATDMNSENIVNVFNGGNTAEFSDNKGNDSFAAIMVVSILGPSDEFTEIISQCVKDALTETSNSLDREITPHDIKLVNTGAYSKMTYDYVTKKSDIRESMTKKQTAVDTLIKPLTEDEKKYVEDVADGKIEPKTSLVEKAKANVEEQEKQQVSTSIKDYISVKWLAIGIIAGAFVMAAWWAFLYIVSDKFHTAEEFEHLSGMKTYVRCTNKSESKNPIDRLINQFRYKGVHFSNDEEIAEIISATIKKSSVRSVAIVGNSLDEYMKKLAATLSGMISDVSIQSCTNISYNPKSIGIVNDAEAVIIIEDISKTRVADIVDELNTIGSKKLIGVC